MRVRGMRVKPSERDEGHERDEGQTFKIHLRKMPVPADNRRGMRVKPSKFI
jgi:hypothetical protein